MKGTKGKFLRRSKGITLVALVVTIVILIILATISVSVVLGEDGLIKQAKDAVKDFKDAQEKEKGDLNKLQQEYLNNLKEDAPPIVEDFGTKIEVTSDMDLATLTEEQRTIDGYYLVKGNIQIDDTSGGTMITTLKSKILEVYNNFNCRIQGGLYYGDIYVNNQGLLELHGGIVNGNINNQGLLELHGGIVNGNINKGEIKVLNGEVKGDIKDASNLEITGGYIDGKITNCKKMRLEGGYFIEQPPEEGIPTGYQIMESDLPGYLFKVEPHF